MIFLPMDWDEILALIEQGEGQSLEFERQITTEEDIAREMAAFANTNGGKLIFGIDDKSKHLIGVEVDDTFPAWVTEIGRAHCTPPIHPTVVVLDRNERNIAIITVPEAEEKPIKTDDICYIRDGKETRPASVPEEQDIKSPWSGFNINKRQKKALLYIADHGTITNREFRNLFGVSHKTAHIELTMMADRGILASEGMGRSTRYILTQASHELLKEKHREAAAETEPTPASSSVEPAIVQPPP